MKRSPIIGMGCILLSLIVVLHLGARDAGAREQAPIIWKALGPWKIDFAETKIWVLPFIEKINKRAKGKLHIKYIGGPEVVPTFQQLKPVSSGTYQLLCAVTVYFYPVFPASAVTGITPSYAEQQRAVGLTKMLDDLWQEKVNIKYLPITMDDRFHFYLRKPIRNLDDLAGLKIRSIFLWDALVKALGAHVVNLAMPEVYTALEKGVVDGFITVETGLTTYRFHEVVKYVVNPGFGHPATGFLINLDAWKALPDDLKAIVDQAAIDQTNEAMVMIREEAKKEQHELIEKWGLKSIELSPEDAKKLVRLWEEESWKHLIYNRLPNLGPKLRELAKAAEDRR